MEDIQRKYDFQPGTKISSTQVDEELNQLVGAINTHNFEISALQEVDAATDTRLDTLEEANPYFYNVTGNLANANPSELQTLPIDATTLRNNVGFTMGTNQMVATKPGMYYVDLQSEWSGATADIEFNGIIRRIKAGGSYQDHVFIYRGAVSGNAGGFQVKGSIIVDLAVGDKLQFFNRHYESGPRKVMNSWVKVFKISKL